MSVYRHTEYRLPPPYRINRTDPGWTWFGLVLGLASALFIATGAS